MNWPLGIFRQCSLTSLSTTRGAPGLQPPMHCIFQDRTRLTMIRRFRSKVQNYGMIYHQTSEIAQRSIDLKGLLSSICSIVICLTIPSRTTFCSETGLTYRHFIPVSRFRIYFRKFRTEISCLRWSIGIKYLYS